MIDVVGQSIDDARPTLEARGLIVEVVEEPRAKTAWIRPGAVVAQAPAPGSRVAPGSTVKLTIRATS